MSADCHKSVPALKWPLVSLGAKAPIMPTTADGKALVHLAIARVDTSIDNKVTWLLLHTYYDEH